MLDVPVTAWNAVAVYSLMIKTALWPSDFSAVGGKPPKQKKKKSVLSPANGTVLNNSSDFLQKDSGLSGGRED